MHGTHETPIEYYKFLTEFSTQIGKMGELRIKKDVWKLPT
jgi:hypothetical protein